MSNAASPGPPPRGLCAVGWRRDAPPGSYAANHAAGTLGPDGLTLGLELDFGELLDRAPQGLLPRGVNEIEIGIRRAETAIAGDAETVPLVQQQINRRPDGHVRPHRRVER